MARSIKKRLSKLLLSKDVEVGKIRRIGGSAESVIRTMRQEMKKRKKKGKRESFRQLIGEEKVFKTPLDL